MNTYRTVVLPVLFGVAAVLVSIAAVVLIVTAVADGGNDADAEVALRSSVVADEMRERFGEDGRPSLRGFAFERMGDLDRTYLGVTVDEEDGAVVVRSVLPGGPADEAGVQPGDTIRAVNGTGVATIDGLRDAIAAIEEGDEYTIEIAREGDEQSVTVQRRTMADAMRAGIDGAFDRFHEWAPRETPSGTPAP